ncbi:hypothetical protein D3C73_1664570 [compost metagenome]
MLNLVGQVITSSITQALLLMLYDQELPGMAKVSIFLLSGCPVNDATFDSLPAPF